HMRGEIDPKHAAAVGVIGQRDSGAYTDLENSSADAFAGSNRRPSAPFEYRAEHQIIDWRPSRIDLCDSISVDIGSHHVSRSSPISGSTSRGETHARHEHLAHWPAALSGRRALRLQCQAVGPARPQERVKVLRKSDDTLMSKRAGCAVGL